MTVPYPIASRWPNDLSMRWSARLDRPRLAQRFEALLRLHGAPIAYELFGRDILLCDPAVPGVAGDPHITLVLGDAEHGLFLVAQRERGSLFYVSVHEAIEDAACDLFVRAAPRLAGLRELLSPLIGACLD